MSRTIRKPYRGTRAVDASCRSHGDCPWCQNSRKHKNKKRDIYEQKIGSYFKEKHH